MSETTPIFPSFKQRACLFGEMHRDFERFQASRWFFGSACAKWHSKVATQYEEACRFPDAFTEQDFTRFERCVTRALQSGNCKANPPRIERDDWDDD